MNARKFVFFSLSLVVLLCFILIYLQFYYQFSRKNLFIEVPSLIINNLDGKIANLKNFTTDIPSVLIYFNSSCPICQSEAELIKRNFRADSLTRFLWVSSESSEDIKNFAVQYKLDNLDTHRFYSDTLFRLASAFKLTGVPATFVYDAEGNLVNYSLGAVSMSDLTLSIQKAHDRSR
ncbi:redoxin domain-containing protein [Algoriphagus sp.]|uniref:TlpA family protein disulfide reductase n=1 Tax=Algoriphagus sp. TaxID=1872435 RepID=UPI00262F3102|nr:redoxin domain-containing protein [Algoriphagus sp.]